MVKYRNRGKKAEGWLLFFYSVPSRPVSNRMKVWRRLAKAGAVQLKGSVYILPMNEEHYEFFQWLVSEVSAMGGEAAFTHIERIDSMKDREVVDLFVRHSEEGYQGIEKILRGVETRVNSIRKGSRPQNLKSLSEQITRLTRGFDDIRKTDFFSSKAGASLQTRIAALNAAIKGFSDVAPGKETVVVARKRVGDYRGRTWVTRRRPFVDRIASAWLIRAFIDRDAVFKTVDERDLSALEGDHVTFDVSGGEFTHVGDLCTFEVLVKTFGLKDKAVRKIAEIVHELDMKDGKFAAPEAGGIEEILIGLRKSVKDDVELLEKGMTLFEMLYVSKT